MVAWIGYRVALLLLVAVAVWKIPLRNKRLFLWTLGAILAIGLASYQLLQVANTAGLSALLLAPFLNGLIFILLFAYKQRQDPQSPLPGFVPLVLGQASILVGAELAILFAGLFEGVICILMAAPFFWLLTILGAALGYAIVRNRLAPPKGPMMLMVGLVAVLPMFSQFAEDRWLVKTLTTHVTTKVEINASPARVFELVKAFPPIPQDQPPRHPAELLFWGGLPAPQQSTIDCGGPGCLRHCLFNQNTHFEERVTVYKPGRELTFNVVSVVGPQNPLSGVDIHVMPGGMYFDNHQGQFLLEEIAPGKTRVRGTTWYTLRSSFNGYSRLWADLFLHTIHRRVLEHIKHEAEKRPA